MPGFFVFIFWDNTPTYTNTTAAAIIFQLFP